MDRGSWQATVHGATMIQKQVSDLHFTLFPIYSPPNKISRMFKIVLFRQ